MLPYAERFGCPSKHDHAQYPMMYACMNRMFAKSYANLQMDRRLNDSRLLQQRLDEAATPNFGTKSGQGRKAKARERYTFLPAAVGQSSGSIDVSWPSGIFMQSGSDARMGGVPIARPSHIPERMSAPVVDVTAWLKQHFRATDIIIVKMDVEGAEHGILRKMAADGTLKWMTVLG